MHTVASSQVTTPSTPNPMDKPAILVLLCCIAAIFTESSAEGDNIGNGNETVKLFVFGDSYADTGNTILSTACWKQPYGITFPGKPAGRFSDGHVFTDYIASFLGIESPIPYNKRNTSSQLKDGMNFAFGGTGVFDTLINEPNMTTQIDFFQNLVHDQQNQTGFNLDSSIALLSVSGNDYVAFLQRNLTNILKLKSLSKSIVNQIEKNIIRLQSLGVKKIAVTQMGPAGCLPAFSFLTFYTECFAPLNSVSEYHNQLLNETVQKMGNSSNVEILDLYSAIYSALHAQTYTGDMGDVKLEQLLKPCCEGSSIEDSCGSTDESGAKKYTLCGNPGKAFYWDKEHPTQNGWNAIYSALKPSLSKLIN